MGLRCHASNALLQEIFCSVLSGPSSVGIACHGSFFVYSYSLPDTDLPMESDEDDEAKSEREYRQLSLQRYTSDLQQHMRQIVSSFLRRFDGWCRQRKKRKG
jgi:hypothetical protein